jgi:hypothetical protein
MKSHAFVFQIFDYFLGEKLKKNERFEKLMWELQTYISRDIRRTHNLLLAKNELHVVPFHSLFSDAYKPLSLKISFGLSQNFLHNKTTSKKNFSDH